MENSTARKHLARLAVPLALMLALAGCVPSDPDTQDTGEANDDGGNQLVVGTTAGVVNFNPLVGNSRTDTWVTNLMYPSMMTLNDEAEKVPSVATEWGYSEDGLTAFVELRDDMEWTDGEPLNAEDVIFTINAIKEEQIGTVAGMLAAYESAEAVSDTRIEFTLSRPDGAFLNSVGFWMPIVPEHVFGEAPSVAEFANDSDWVSAGPFVLTEVEDGQRYVLEATENYPLVESGSANVDEVIFRVFPDVNTEVLALRAGDLDMIGNALPPAVAEDLAGDDSVQLFTVPSLGWAHMQYNMRRAPLDQVEVREALAHAVDYDAIREVVLGGNAISSNSSVLTPVYEQWQDGLDLEEYAYDPEMSRQLLEDAGFADADGDDVYDELSFEMVYDQGDPMVSTWAELVQDQSLDAGINIELVGLDRNTYLARTADRDFDIYAGSWAIIDEPQSNFALLFSPEGFINYAGVDDPEVSELMEEAATALTPEVAQEPLQEIARIVHDQVYDNVMYVETFNFAASSEWSGFVPKPSDLLSIVNAESLANVSKE
ncbi:ABC transporter substrate-binding protein [Arthrobacter sp. H5]|uniref:ABC transporter substrate-binding protein n=1 Tax=Arthrobacter sp. H5 TaxID=1267973 RepID=UPI0004B17756|nr:ABC transporter substrate-binding protein [Arthrobacter sp. H5]